MSAPKPESNPAPMIVLLTDFGLDGPYVGQVRAVLLREAPGLPVVDLCHDVPAARPDLAAYLLAAWIGTFPRGSVVLAVVDPEVGGDRRALAIEAGGRWFVGPDNGLLAIVARRGGATACRVLDPGDAPLSASFHGRDLFAPAAARIARGTEPPGQACEIAGLVGADWPDDLARVAYVDRFGNAATGLRAAGIETSATIEADGRRIGHARVFADVAPGEPFWYENANGLIEIAANRANAAALLGLAPGDPISIVPMG